MRACPACGNCAVSFEKPQGTLCEKCIAKSATVIVKARGRGAKIKK